MHTASRSLRPNRLLFFQEIYSRSAVVKTIFFIFGFRADENKSRPEKEPGRECAGPSGWHERPKYTVAAVLAPYTTKKEVCFSRDPESCDVLRPSSAC